MDEYPTYLLKRDYQVYRYMVKNCIRFQVKIRLKDGIIR